VIKEFVFNMEKDTKRRRETSVKRQELEIESQRSRLSVSSNPIPNFCSRKSYDEIRMNNMVRSQAKREEIESMGQCKFKPDLVASPT
jgi:hypothetical protein